MYVECLVDGSSRGQGQRKIGEAACAAVIYKNSKLVAQYARGLGRRTNNEAEYEAVLTALLICSMGDLLDPTIYSDSAVVVNQVNGKWKCTNRNLVPLLMSVQSIQKEFRFRLIQVPRRKISVADNLANAFLDELDDYRKRLSKD